MEKKNRSLRYTVSNKSLITAAAMDGSEVKAVCKVTVQEKPKSVLVEEEKAGLQAIEKTTSPLTALGQGITVLCYVALDLMGLGGLLLPNLQGFLDDEVFMLAAVIYGEGGEKCKERELTAIALTVRNRVNSKDRYNFQDNNYKDTIRKGYAAYEASNGYYKRAMNYLTGRTRYPGMREPNNSEKRNMRRCLRIALLVYYDYTSDFTDGCVAYNGDGTSYGPSFVKWNQPSDWLHKYWYKPA